VFANDCLPRPSTRLVLVYSSVTYVSVTLLCKVRTDPLNMSHTIIKFVFEINSCRLIQLEELCSLHLVHTKECSGVYRVLGTYYRV